MAQNQQVPQAPPAPTGFSGALGPDVLMSPDFRMYCYKVVPCTRRYGHDWTACPFNHPGEKATRRCPQKHNYMPVACPDIKTNNECPRGESCMFAHNVFEYWLHPMRYRTQLCSYGHDCKRAICFFAHSYNELRVVDQSHLQELERQLDALGQGSTTFGFPGAAPRQPTPAQQQQAVAAQQAAQQQQQQQGGQQTQATPKQSGHHAGCCAPSPEHTCAPGSSSSVEASSPACAVLAQLQQMQQQGQAQNQNQQDKVLQAAQLLGVDPVQLAQFHAQQQASRARVTSTSTQAAATGVGAQIAPAAMLQAAVQLLGPQGAQVLTGMAARLQQQQQQQQGGMPAGLAAAAAALFGDTSASTPPMLTPTQSLSFNSLPSVPSLTADVDQMTATMQLLASMQRQSANTAEPSAATLARTAGNTPRANADYSNTQSLLHSTASLDSSLDSAVGNNTAVNQLIAQLQQLSTKMGGAPPPAPAPAPSTPTQLSPSYSLPANAFGGNATANMGVGAAAGAGAGGDLQAVLNLLPLLAKQLTGGSASVSASPASTPTMAQQRPSATAGAGQAGLLTGVFGGAAGAASAAAAAATTASPRAPVTPLSACNTPPHSSSNAAGAVPSALASLQAHHSPLQAKLSAALSHTTSLSPVDVLSIRSQRSGALHSGTASCAGSDGSCSPPPSHQDHGLGGLAGGAAAHLAATAEAVEAVEMDDLVAHPDLPGADRMLHSLSMLVSGGSDGGAPPASLLDFASGPVPSAYSADCVGTLLSKMSRAAGSLGVIGDGKGASEDGRCKSFDLPVSL